MLNKKYTFRFVVNREGSKLSAGVTPTPMSIGVNSQSERGFTLIELLVVIAIIGILISVVLASLSPARNKGQDEAIKEDLFNIKTQAELYYFDNRNYGKDFNGDCSAAGTGTMFKDDSTIVAAISSILKINGGRSLTCITDDGIAGSGTSAISYAISSSLQSVGTWCIDSSGAVFSSAIAKKAGNIASCIVASPQRP